MFVNFFPRLNTRVQLKKNSNIELHEEGGLPVLKPSYWNFLEDICNFYFYILIEYDDFPMTNTNNSDLLRKNNNCIIIRCAVRTFVIVVIYIRHKSSWSMMNDDILPLDTMNNVSYNPIWRYVRTAIHPCRDRSYLFIILYIK